MSNQHTAQSIQTPSSSTLTKLSLTDIRAFKECDSILVWHTAATKNRMELRKRLPKKGPFDDEERTHALVVETRIDGAYADWLANGAHERAEGFVSLERYTFARSEMASFIAFLRQGDEIEVDFCAMLCSNAVHKSLVTKGGTYDSCMIEDSRPARVQGVRFVVVRKNRRDERERFPFLVHVMVTFTDSLAAPVRRR